MKLQVLCGADFFFTRVMKMVSFHNFDQLRQMSHNLNMKAMKIINKVNFLKHIS